uniref:Uncharacterized protein n=1 Tax=Biomphalaria glabrata TaxID=6526 RepID=A0A2C9KY14_BIOGL
MLYCWWRDVSLKKMCGGLIMHAVEKINISIWNIIPVIVILFPTSTEGCDTQGEINVTLSNITLKENRDYLIENETLQTKGFIYIANYDINSIQATCKILNGNTKETLEEV